MPSKNNDTWYITTSIPYVNATPHIGFALEMIQADVYARYRRERGYDVRFQAGADENSLKNVQAAKAAGLDTEHLVAQNAAEFQNLRHSLNLTTDDFIRTSTDLRHLAAVQKIWSACWANGDIYKKFYRGKYCIGCEQFYKPSELVKGLCPDHQTKPIEIAEENYFFRLSNFQNQLRDLLQSKNLKVHPAHRRNEVLAWIDRGLEDFSISRASTRAHGWGITVPGDPNQVIYVWFDALVNYISALGYGSNEAELERYWRRSHRRDHIIGKGISRFHALYWPAMLLSAGLTLPTDIFVHGYVTVDGRKISKSVGTVIDPNSLVDEFGSDVLRYFLLRHIRSTEDGDYSLERFKTAYRSELAGQFGNLAHRTITMIHQYCHGVIPTPALSQSEPGALVRAIPDLIASVDRHLEDYSFHEALAAIWTYIALANKYVNVQQPWTLAKHQVDREDVNQIEEDRSLLNTCLYQLVAALKAIAVLIAPFLPKASAQLLQQLGCAGDISLEQITNSLAGNKIGPAKPLFPPLPGCS